MRVRSEEEMRAGFVAGTWPWRPGPEFNDWAEPCPCGNDGVCCDKPDDMDNSREA